MPLKVTKKKTRDASWFIVPVSDCIDVAEQEIRAQIYHWTLKETGNLRNIIIEPVSPVFPLSIINASFIIRLLADEYPEEQTIIHAVVHPLREQPERIVGITKKRGIIFIGRNTGAFGWLVKDLGVRRVYKIPVTKYVPFGGKTVYPKFIAKIVKANGDLEALENEGLLEPLAPSKIRSSPIKYGTVVHIDNFGLCKIYMPPTIFRDLNLKEGDFIQVRINNSKTLIARYVSKLRDADDGEVVVYPGSSFEMPEIGIVRNFEGCRKLDISVGDVVEFKRYV